MHLRLHLLGHESPWYKLAVLARCQDLMIGLELIWSLGKDDGLAGQSKLVAVGVLLWGCLDVDVDVEAIFLFVYLITVKSFLLMLVVPGLLSVGI